MQTATGLDVLVKENFERLHGKTIGLVCNQASVDHNYRHAIELFLPLHRAGTLRLAALFGPQHGLFGHTQDNMVEWESGDNPRQEVPVHSLYGQHREPTKEMLEGIDTLVIDLQEVGSRYYTFNWTTALCLKACAEFGVEVMVLDRPNPIGGTHVEGTVLTTPYASFVGLHPLPTRHGMTLGEIASYLRGTFYQTTQLQVVKMEGWIRDQYADETDTPWTLPSPNMPTVSTAVVYPGGCLLEATDVSEGRGTTRPFELVGSPYLDGRKFCNVMNGFNLPGVRFQPMQFEPMFSKHAKTSCEGAYVHVLDRIVFEPVLTYVAILQTAKRQSGAGFSWNSPPYEYEYEKLPIDILAGNLWLRQAIDEMAPLSSIRERFREECDKFEPERQNWLLYR
jgi:uncharacterized protein YbbC (DUF1343 family)